MTSVLTYMTGSWSNPKEVPKPGRPLSTYIPQIPDGATNAEINQILADAGLVTLDADGNVVDNGKLMGNLVTNGSMARENREEQRAYSNAVNDAVDNQVNEARAQAQGQARARGETQRALAKSIQQSQQQKKSMERALMARMINKWVSNNRAEGKRKKAEG